MEISLESVESHAVPHSILPNHTEGHRLNGRDALSRKAGLRLGKDSAGVGVKNLLGQSSLKYCRRRGLNRCPLAWELGTLPLDQLDLTTQLFTRSKRLGLKFCHLQRLVNSTLALKNFHITKFGPANLFATINHFRNSRWHIARIRIIHKRRQHLFLKILTPTSTILYL